ncbi:fibronectin type III domain-containing protein, partial [Actinoplanes sp. TFC3]|uniref:fibronectin type III domain-containing protein n=1 Tax=Actinoplanes sp. TFC3 TaxID=1710355 RepID=UPI001F2CF9E7
MRHVPPVLAQLTAQAQSLTAEGDLTAARDVLAPALNPAEADPHRATPDLALAAALQARILIALGDPHAARLWAGFAHAAEDRLHGPSDERTIAAAATHAAVLHQIGNYGHAAQLYHELVAQLTTSDGPLSQRVLAAEADLATSEHAAGHCTEARTRLQDAWTRHREVYGDSSPAGMKMLARLGAMERECGRTTEAGIHLALAQELCARYLPADHPMAQQVARLAGTPPTGRHRCGEVRRSTGPAVNEAAVAAPVAAQDSPAPEALQPEAAQPEAAQPDVTRSEAARPDLGQPDPAQPELGRPDPAQPELGRPDPAQPGPAAVQAGSPIPSQPIPGHDAGPLQANPAPADPRQGGPITI